MTFDSASIPTKVDVDAFTGRGSARPGGVRSHAVRLDFTESANRIISQVNGLTKAIQSIRPEFDHDGMTAIRLHAIGAALNDILTRAVELDDPVLKATLTRLGVFEDDKPRPIRFSADDPSPLGLDPTSPAVVPDEQQVEISGHIRAGIHHTSSWILEAALSTLADQDQLDIIASAILAGATSGSAPNWRLWVRS